MVSCEFCSQLLESRPNNGRLQHNDCLARRDERVKNGKCVYCGENDLIGNGNLTCNGKCQSIYEGY